MFPTRSSKNKTRRFILEKKHNKSHFTTEYVCACRKKPSHKLLYNNIFVTACSFFHAPYFYCVYYDDRYHARGSI